MVLLFPVVLQSAWPVQSTKVQVSFTTANAIPMTYQITGGLIYRFMIHATRM